MRYIGLADLEDFEDNARFRYYCDGYFVMARLFIPFCSPQTHYLHEGLNAAEEFQREYEPEPLHVDLGVRTERLGWWGFSKHRTSL